MENMQDKLRRIEKSNPGTLDELSKLNPNKPYFMNEKEESQKIRNAVGDVLPNEIESELQTAIEEDEKLTPVEDALYATGKFTPEQCTKIAKGILLYLDDANIMLMKQCKEKV